MREIKVFPKLTELERRHIVNALKIWIGEFGPVKLDGKGLWMDDVQKLLAKLGETESWSKGSDKCDHGSGPTGHDRKTSPHCYECALGAKESELAEAKENISCIKISDENGWAEAGREGKRRIEAEAKIQSLYRKLENQDLVVGELKELFTTISRGLRNEGGGNVADAIDKAWASAGADRIREKIKREAVEDFINHLLVENKESPMSPHHLYELLKAELQDIRVSKHSEAQSA